MLNPFFCIICQKALYNVYVRIFELRSSVTKKKAKLHQARRARRLNALLSFQVINLCMQRVTWHLFMTYEDMIEDASIFVKIV